MSDWEWPERCHEREPAPPPKWCRDLTTRQTLLALKGEVGDFWQIHASWNLGQISGEEYADLMRKRWHDDLGGSILLGHLAESQS